MEILVERFDDAQNEILIEEKTGDKKYIIEGICIQPDIKNRNGRIYPSKLVDPLIEKYITDELEKGRAVGHLNHPTGDPRNDYKEVSHKFESLKKVGPNQVGRAVVTKGTPNGKIVAGLMDEGVNMGISSRALGKTKLFEDRKFGQAKVVQTFQLMSPGDIVSDPSAPDAYLTNLMEGKEQVQQDGMLVEREKDVRAEVDKAAREGKLDEAKMLELFEKFIKLTSKGSSNA